jgi:nitroimidazol reductase NimA-like FMN-containing flavoprotein (pyridoxamine 5'-phosphate oxidase superfamily)
VDGIVDMRMSAEERARFLADPKYAVVAIPAEGRAPLVTPVWYRYAPGGDIVFTCEAESEKARRLAMGSKVSINAQDTAIHWGAQYVTVEGEVVGLTTDGGREELHRIAIGYLGEEEAAAYMSVVPAEMVMTSVTIRPGRWLSRDYRKMTGAS